MRAYAKSIGIGVLLIALMLTGIFIYQDRIHRTIYEESTASLHTTYEQVGKTLTLFTQRNWNVLNASASLLLQSEDAEELENTWYEIAKGKESWQYTDFYLFNEDSDYITEDGKSGHADSIKGVFDEIYTTDDPIVSTYISSSGIRRIVYAIRLSEPVALDGVTYSGIAVTYDNDVVQDYITSSIYNDESDCYIVKSSGDVLFSLQKKSIFTDFVVNMCDFIDERGVLSSGECNQMREGIASEQTGSEIATYQGDEIYIVYQPVGINDWSLVSIVKCDSVDRGITRALHYTIAFLVAVSIIAALLAIGVVTWFDHRRIRLAEEKQRVAEVGREFAKQLFQGMGKIIERVAWADLKSNTYEYREHTFEEKLYPESGAYETLIEGISRRYVAIGDTKEAKITNLLSPDNLRKVLPEGVDMFKFEYCTRSQDNYSLMTVVAIERDDDGVVSKVMLVGQDIGQKIELQNAANTDSLTELFNERYFSAVLHAKAVRHEPFVLFYLDLDRFKPVNDTYGHDMGDKLLKEVAQRLLDCIRAHDYAFRIGGDEFALVVSAEYSEAFCLEMKGRIAKEIEKPFIIDGTTIDVGTSCGYAHFPGEGDPEQVRILADERMYEAKAVHHERQPRESSD